MRTEYNAHLGMAAVRPRREQRCNWIIAQHVDKILEHAHAGRMSHEDAVAALTDLGVTLDRITTLLANVDGEIRGRAA